MFRLCVFLYSSSDDFFITVLLVLLVMVLMKAPDGFDDIDWDPDGNSFFMSHMFVPGVLTSLAIVSAVLFIVLVGYKYYNERRIRGRYRVYSMGQYGSGSADVLGTAVAAASTSTNRYQSIN